MASVLSLNICIMGFEVKSVLVVCCTIDVYFRFPVGYRYWLGVVGKPGSLHQKHIFLATYSLRSRKNFLT